MAHLKQLEIQWKDKPVLLRAQGECHLRLGQSDQAVNLLERTLAVRPDDQLALLYLGQALMQKGELERAMRVLGRLVEDNPKNDQAQYDLGVALGKLGRTGEASLHLGLAFRIRGNERMAMYHLKRAEKDLSGQPELQKQAKDAIDDIEEARKKRPPQQQGPE